MLRQMSLSQLYVQLHCRLTIFMMRTCSWVFVHGDLQGILYRINKLHLPRVTCTRDRIKSFEQDRHNKINYLGSFHLCVYQPVWADEGIVGAAPIIWNLMTSETS